MTKSKNKIVATFLLAIIIMTNVLPIGTDDFSTRGKGRGFVSENIKWSLGMWKVTGNIL